MSNKRTMRFIGGRADGMDLTVEGEPGPLCWVAAIPGESDVLRFCFDAPEGAMQPWDTYELVRHWPSLRWYYVEWTLLDTPIGEPFGGRPGEKPDVV